MTVLLRVVPHAGVAPSPPLPLRDRALPQDPVGEEVPLSSPQHPPRELVAHRSLSLP